MTSWYAASVDLSPLRDSDLEVIGSTDRLPRCELYEQHVVKADTGEAIHGAAKLRPVPPVTDSGVSVRPQGLAKVLRRVAGEYTSLPLYVTENGAAFNDYITPEDASRIRSGSTTYLSTSTPWVGMSPTGLTYAAISSGRCSTTSNGLTDTRAGLA